MANLPGQVENLLEWLAGPLWGEALKKGLSRELNFRRLLRTEPVVNRDSLGRWNMRNFRIGIYPAKMSLYMHISGYHEIRVNFCIYNYCWP